jgi:hypothetical protein
MSFEYVWGMLRVTGTPPDSATHHISANGYRFHPFSSKGAIYTFDVAVWEIPELSHFEAKASKITFWPSAGQIEEYLINRGNRSDCRMMALSDQSTAKTIDPTNPVILSKIPNSSKDEFSSCFSNVGYDVIDKSGLSALVNIGYSKADLDNIADMKIDINESGLISSVECSNKFSEFASSVAPEHAPFFGVSIWRAKI